MTEIANSTMFTNGRLSSGPSNLIQQAFQGVDEEEDHHNFVAYIESDENGSQMIRLSPEAAAQFGFNVNMEGGISGEVTFLPSDGDAVPEMQAEINTENVSNVNCSRYDEWSVESLNQTETFQHGNNMGTNISMDLVNSDNLPQDSSSLVEHSNELMQVDSVLQQDNISNFDKSQMTSAENCMQYALLDNQSSQTPSFVTVTTSQGQILQNLPMMIPTSQYSLKPIQPITKTSKNVRILPNAGKNITPVTTIHSLNNGTTSNAVIFSNATLLNSVTPQVIKAMPISTQFLNSNGLVSASDFLSGSCEISNQSVNGTLSDSIANTPNLINNQLSQLIKVNPNSIQTGNLHQVVTSVMKTSNPSSPTLKNTPIFTTSNVTSPTNFRKTVNPIVRSVTKSVSKTSPKVTNNVVLQSAPQVKVQDIRNNTSPSSVLRTNSSVSLLKQQPKTTFAKRIVNLQSLNNIANNVQNLQKTINLKQNNVERTCEKSPVTAMKVQEVSNQLRNIKNLKNLKSMPNVVLEKVKGSNYCAIKSAGNCTLTNSTTLHPSARIAISKTKLNPLTTTSNTVVATLKSNSLNSNGILKTETPVKQEIAKVDNSKPLGTCKNPIPIITHSKGKTFIIDDGVPASQISQIIQKFNRDQHNFDQFTNEENANNSKEKVVYQIVYPTDLDLIGRRAPSQVVQKRPAKRGRPKKNTVKPQPPPPSKPVSEEDRELKNERKKVVARTRSGRLSRPPKHMVRDYKHLHPVDFTQPDLDDSDGGYSDYNTNGDFPDDDESPKELLTGLEVPKRKVSKEYLCPTCSKTYLGREKMIFHFQKYPSHGSMDQLPPPKPKTEVGQTLDTLKRKGKKRGPWGTPEEKSARRQEKLKNAIAVCEKNEICNIAAKPVLNALSLFDLMVLKSENNVMNFMRILKDLMNNVRERASSMLTTPNEDERNTPDIMDLNDDLLCDALGLNPGLYKINNVFARKESNIEDEPPLKKAKIESLEEELLHHHHHHHLEERASSGFSDGSDISSSSNCPEVLTALTLVPRNTTSPHDEPCKLIGSKLVISNPEIQNELCDNNGFRKIDISNNSFQKFEAPLEDQTFIKLQSTDKKFIKLENGIMGNYQNPPPEENFPEMQSFTTAGESYTKSFQTSGESNSNIFEGLENLEVKMNYDHLAQLAMLNATGEMEQSHMTEQIEQIVSDKLSDMIPGDLLENNLISTNSISSDISFAFNSSLTEEYPFRSIRS